LWIVLIRRVQAGRWMELPDHARNAAWAPPPLIARPAEAPAAARTALSPRVRLAWLAIGAVSVAAIGALMLLRESGNPYGYLPIGRSRAITVARDELAKRNAAPGPKWRVMGVPDDGGGGAHQFVHETAGPARWRELLGVYLPKPSWRVRVATFEGDVADRAEEWRVYVDAQGNVRSVQHVVPEGRAGAALDEAAARARAVAAVQAKYGMDTGRLKEISAKPAKQKARTDWTFTFTDTGIPALPQGEPRIDVTLAGDEVSSVGRYVHVPEEWERHQRASSTRNLIIQIASSVVFGGLLVAAAIGGMVAWSRGRYAPRVFLLGAAVTLAAALAGFANGWPALLANLPTAAPLVLSLIGVVAIAGIGLMLLGTMVGLAVGALPAKLAGAGRIADGDALPLGIAAGAFGAATGALAATIRTPEWARFPSVGSLATAVPLLDVVLDPITSFMTTMALVMTLILAIDRLTGSWTRRRALGGAALAAVGFLAGGVPPGSEVLPWLLSAAMMSAALVAVYVTLLRFDPALVPLALGAMAGIRALGLVAERPFPGAAAGAIVAAAVVMALSWWWFRVLRRMV